MILRIDSRTALPVYEQICSQITRMVIVGTLSADFRLPTIRQLAADLGVAKGTVARAYALLEAGNIVESRGHRGTFVMAPTSDRASTIDIAHEAESYVVSARQTGVALETALDEVRRAWRSF